MINLLFYFILFLTTLNGIHTQAKVIQILHTNDLHSYFQGTRMNQGGYAQLKFQVDQLIQQAKEKNIPTLYVDGGDFGEGSSFYFSNKGQDSFRALDLLGVDVTVLGNHDYMFGNRELKKQILESGVQTKIISANLRGRALTGLKKLIPKHVDFYFDDIKVRVFGLTTSELHFMYPLRPASYIGSVIKTGLREEKKAYKNQADLILALTHVGIEKDEEFVQRSRYTDLVIGGHSHTVLPLPKMVQNSFQRPTPIFQAGAHGGYIGKITLDVEKNKKPQILNYELIAIRKDMPKDPVLTDFSEKAYQKREHYFGRSWDEVLGYSEIPFSGDINGTLYIRKNCWSQHIARMTKNAVKADVSFQFDDFQGEFIPPGVITYGDMIDNFPHFRRWNDQGWKVAKTRMSGYLLKQLIGFISFSDYSESVSIDGVSTYDQRKKLLKPYLFDSPIHSEMASKFATDTSALSTPKELLGKETLYINGDKIRNFKFYYVALPSEVPFALKKILGPFKRLFLKNLRTMKDTSYWPLLENYIRENSPITCL